MDGDQRGQVAIVLPMGKNPESLLYEVEEHQNLLVVEFTTLLAQNSISGTKTHMVWQALACHSAWRGQQRGNPHFAPCLLRDQLGALQDPLTKPFKFCVGPAVWSLRVSAAMCQPGKWPRSTGISCLLPQLSLSGLSGLPYLVSHPPQRGDSECSYRSSFSQKGPYPRFPRVGVTLHYPLFCPRWPQCPLRCCDQGCWH